MALSIALPLSGLEPEHFRALSAHLSFEQGVRALSGNFGNLGPASPSTGSESSGVSSLAQSGETTSCTSELSPATTRPNSPSEEPHQSSQPKVAKTLVRVLYKERDILNLGANIREPSWQMRSPTIPRNDLKAFMANRSIYYRLGDHGLEEEYPMRSCKECEFKEPSPYLF